jgi:hypothetical protein
LLQLTRLKNNWDNDKIAALVFLTLLHNLREVVTRQQLISHAVRSSRTAPEFRRALDDLRSAHPEWQNPLPPPLMLGEDDPSLHVAGQVYLDGTPRFESIPDFKSDPISDFLRFNRSRPRALDSASLLSLWSDLNEFTALINNALTQLQSCRTAPPPWGAWAARVPIGLAGVQEVDQMIEPYRLLKRRTLTQFQSAERAVERLQSWFDARVSAMQDLDLGEAAVAALSPSDRNVLNGIVSMMGPLSILLKNTATTIESRRDLEIAHLGAMSDLTLLVGNYLETQLRTSSRTEDAAAALSAIQEALARLGAKPLAKSAGDH